jgi:isopenicillin N synthase-like dioxygenase
VRSECALYGSNRWATHLPEMAAVVGSWWTAMDALACRLVDGLADFLGLGGKTLASTRAAPLTNVTLLHYPKRRADDPTPGFHPHKDITVVSILDPDPVGGLEVRTRDGTWVEAGCPGDALLVNVGDLLEVWSGGRLVSTPHRVANPDGAERYSAPFFVVPNHGVVVEPLLEPVAGFEPRSVPVGAVTAEVWRTNWPDEEPSDTDTHLGTVEA